MAEPNPPQKGIVVGVGDMAVSDDVSAELVADLVTHSLGSCIGVIIYDPVKHVGGLLHAMLPNSLINPEKAKRTPAMFVDTGVPLLFRTAYELGAEKQRIIIKVVGGAEILDENKLFNIGKRNYQALVEILTHNGVRISAEQVGGQTSRTVRLDMKTGNVLIQSPGEEKIIL
jgi:chemotaxis protein CheD